MWKIVSVLCTVQVMVFKNLQILSSQALQVIVKKIVVSLSVVQDTLLKKPLDVVHLPTSDGRDSCFVSGIFVSEISVEDKMGGGLDEIELPIIDEHVDDWNTSRNSEFASTKNQQKNVGRGCYVERVDLDTM